LFGHWLPEIQNYVEQLREPQIYKAEKRSDCSRHCENHNRKACGLFPARPGYPTQLGYDLAENVTAQRSARHVPLCAWVTGHVSLPDFPMQSMGAAAGAELLEFQPLRVVTAVLIGVIGPLAALHAPKVD
jgi:hypothetical protein